MTDREKAIVMAYTGYCMLAGDKLKVFYEYVGELLGRPVYTHELANPVIQEKASNDFYKLCKETTPEDIADLQKEADYWHKLSQSYAHTICEMSKAIAQKGEIDKVVHCKDCIHHKPFPFSDEYFCDVFNWKSKDDDFCSFAERRTE